MAVAIAYRAIQNGFEVPSLRTKHLGLDDPTVAEASTQPATISGIERQEFPEPTTIAAAALLEMDTKGLR